MAKTVDGPVNDNLNHILRMTTISCGHGPATDAANGQAHMTTAGKDRIMRFADTL
jgi:hypothetical protein